MNVIFNIHMTCSSNQLEIVFLSEGEALAVVVQAFQENRYRTRVFPRPHHLKRRGCAPRVPLPSGGDGGAQKGGKWRERPPFYPSKCATERG